MMPRRRLEDMQRAADAVVCEAADFSMAIGDAIVTAEQLRALMDYNPFPFWMKRYVPEQKVFRMMWVSRAYEKEWGVPTERYRGRRDDEIWPADIARGFAHNDRMVWERADSGSIYVVEQVPDAPLTDPDGPSRTWVIVKYPAPCRDGVIDVGGIAIEPSKLLPGHLPQLPGPTHGLESS